MRSGSLEGSWYYYLLIKNQLVKRNKATTIPITDDIISFTNSKSIGRKENLTNQIYLNLKEESNILL